MDNNQLLAEVFSTLQWASYIRPEGDPPQGKRPKAYIVILKNSNVGISSSVYDVGAAMENMILVALEAGIGSCPIASVDRDKLRRILNIPDDYEIKPLIVCQDGAHLSKMLEELVSAQDYDIKRYGGDDELVNLVESYLH